MRHLSGSAGRESWLPCQRLPEHCHEKAMHCNDSRNCKAQEVSLCACNACVFVTEKLQAITRWPAALADHSGSKNAHHLAALDTTPNFSGQPRQAQNHISCMLTELHMFRTPARHMGSQCCSRATTTWTACIRPVQHTCKFSLSLSVSFSLSSNPGSSNILYLHHGNATEGRIRTFYRTL